MQLELLPLVNSFYVLAIYYIHVRLDRPIPDGCVHYIRNRLLFVTVNTSPRRKIRKDFLYRTVSSPY